MTRAGEVGGVPAVRTHEDAATDLGRLIEQKVRAGYDYRWWIDLQHHADEIIRTVFDEH